MLISSRDWIRKCVFRPYRKGFGPVFTLRIWDTGQKRRGKWMLGYELKQAGTTLFTGEDFGASPLHAVDADETVASLMTFLTLRPGDTDAEYFDGYTQAQWDFVYNHAEALNYYLTCRFEGKGF